MGGATGMGVPRGQPGVYGPQPQPPGVPRGQPGVQGPQPQPTQPPMGGGVGPTAGMTDPAAAANASAYNAAQAQPQGLPADWTPGAMYGQAPPPPPPPPSLPPADQHSTDAFGGGRAGPALGSPMPTVRPKPAMQYREGQSLGGGGGGAWGQ